MILPDAYLDWMEAEARMDFPSVVPSDIRRLVVEIRRLRDEVAARCSCSCGCEAEIDPGGAA